METIGIIMNGVTGRMGTNQHLERSIVSIRKQGGVRLRSGSVVQLQPVLVGRNADKLRLLAMQYGIEKWSTELDGCLSDPSNAIYFDSQVTNLRKASVQAAITAGKHVFCEKPLAPSFQDAMELASAAAAAGLKSGVVQDKLFLPGLVKLKRAIQAGVLGRILSVRGEFGYWVFEGDREGEAPQRPSWNYRKQDGGGIILDMFPHWQYLLENLFDTIKAVSCIAATHILRRIDETGEPYAATADDAVYATFELTNGIIVQLNSSWCTRVNRSDLLILQVDGTEGSAVAGLRECQLQHRSETPRAVWNPDAPDPNNYREAWQMVPSPVRYDNPFKIQWEMFLRHVLEDAPFPHDFFQGARGLQLVEAALRSWAERRWIEVPATPATGSEPRTT